MSLRTRFCEVVGIEAPVCSAGMAGEHAGPGLAAAVANAGGVGGVGGGDRGGPGGVRRGSRGTRELAAKAFSVDLWGFLLDAVPLLEGGTARRSWGLRRTIRCSRTCSTSSKGCSGRRGSAGGAS